MKEIEIVTLDESNLGSVQMFCGHSPTYRSGYAAKISWVRERLREGMRYTLLRVNGNNAGLIEYIPGEYAWRGVEAQGYLFIHCFWVRGSYRKQGHGRRLLQYCLEDARGTYGVAVMVSRNHWLPTPKIFLKNGFELINHADPSFDLLVRRLDPNAPAPRFKRATAKIAPGITLLKSDQCPYTQNTANIARQVGEKIGVPVNIQDVDSHGTAQEVPCAYGTLAYYFNGEFLTYHPCGSEKLEQLLGEKATSR